MATAAWATVIQQWDLSGLYGRIKSSGLSYLVSAANASERDIIAQSVGLNQMTTFYKLKLMDKFQKQYPNNGKEWRSLGDRAIVEAQQYVRHMQDVLGANDAVGVSGYMNPTVLAPSILSDGGNILVDNWAQLPRPRPPFPVSGAPVSGTTLAGVADNGDCCTDLTNDRTYINRGTLASPIWQSWATSSLIDYLLNPELMLECGYKRAISYIRDYATDVDDGNNDFRVERMPASVKIKREQATEEEVLAFGLIDVDYSADGLMSDTEVSMGDTSKWVF